MATRTTKTDQRLETAGLTANELLETIVAASRKSTAEPVPEGWISIRDLSKLWNLSYTRTCSIIKQEVAIGRIELKYFRNETGHKTGYIYLPNARKIK